MIQKGDPNSEVAGSLKEKEGEPDYFYKIHLREKFSMTLALATIFPGVKGHMNFSNISMNGLMCYPICYFLSEPHKLQALYFYIMMLKGIRRIKKSKIPVNSL